MPEFMQTPRSAAGRSLAARIDAVADDFEEEWQKKGPPSIADFLGATTGEQRRALLEELVQVDLEYRWQAGDRRALEDYAREFPELAGPDGAFSPVLALRIRQVEEWRTAEATRGMIAQFAASMRSAGTVILRCPQCRNPVDEEAVEGRDVTCPACGNSFRMEAVPGDVVIRTDLPRRLGNFQLVEILGRGAFGTVYKARDEELGRWVAIKLPRSGSFTSEEEHARFLLEARSAAELAHPNIVPVHAIAHDGEIPYIVSEYIEGQTLADLLGQGRLSFRETAELVARIAGALDYAHSRKIVHRDINPRNVLIDGGGLPHLTDFGLARREEGGILVTLDGQVLGTPAYMAPEQAAGHSYAVDGRSDIYSLGVILYQLLTGELPFGGTVRMLLHQVVHEDPRPPRRFNDRVPYDLETICLKAMAKSPSGRYATAGEVAADLRRYLDGEPILARRAGAWERARKWVRRRPAQAAALLATSVAAASLVLALWYWVRLRATREVAAVEIQAARELAATQQYYSLVTGVREARARPRPGWTWTGLAALQRAALLPTPARNTVELRSEAAACLAAFDLREAAVLAKDLVPYCLAFSPDGKRLAIGPLRGLPSCSVPVYDLDSRQLEREFSFPASSDNADMTGVRCLTFSPDGRWLVAGSRDGQMHAWNVEPNSGAAPATGGQWPSPRFSWRAHADQVLGLAFSPDGRLLISCSDDKTIKRWNPWAQWKQVSCLLADRPLCDLASCAEGRLLVCGSRQGVAFVDGASFEALPSKHILSHSSTQHSACNDRVAFSPDGRTLALSDQWSIILFDTRIGKVFRELRDPDLRQAHEDNLAHLAFSADGSLLVSGGHDRKIKVWEVASGRLLVAIAALGVGNIYPVFSPDGRFLATTGNRQTVLYEISRMREQAIVAQHPYPVRAIDYSPDGKTLACLSEETALEGNCRAEVTLWDVASGRVTVREDISGYARDSRSPSSLTFHPGGASLAYSYRESVNKTFRFLDLKTGENRSPGEEWKGVSLSFARDGRTLWSAGNKGNQVASWKVPELSLATVWSNAHSTFGDGRTSVYCVSAGRKWVIAGSWDGSAKLFRQRDGALVTEWPCPGGPVFCVALNNDESWFAAGAQDGAVYVARVPGGGLVAELKAHRDSVDAVSFRSDGGLLATGSRDGTVCIWQRTGDSLEEALTLPAPAGPVVAVSFNPDGSQLAVLVKNELAVRTWNLARLRKRLAEISLNW
jgi:WD40 repeat protein